MSGRSFKSVFMVASCAGAALGCYLVSLRVATERAALEDVETRIVLAQRDLRLLQTEIGTRGRLAQLERWNAKVIALSAPTADQFLAGSFELAKMTAPEHKPAVTAPVVLASAPKPESPSVIGTETGDAPQASRSSTPDSLLHQASLKSVETPSRVDKRVAIAVPKPGVRQAPKAPAKADPKSSAKAPAKIETKLAAKPAAKQKIIAGDPLAPLSAKPAPKKVAAVSPAKTKDMARKQ